MTDPLVEQIISEKTPEIQALLRAARTYLQQAAPTLTEYGQPRLKNIVYRGRDTVVAVSSYARYISLHFYDGIKLNDPHGVLEGGGSKLRHVKVRTLSDLNPAVLDGLVAQSVALDQAG
jgi:hypothetical protein